MRIVKLNENYLKEILKINNHINKEGIGLAVNLRDNYIFIPMTSQTKYEIEKLNYLDYPLFNIGNKRKYGTLVIKDYIYIHHSIIVDVDSDDRIIDEITFFKENREIIEKKIIRRINKYKESYDKKIQEVLFDFLTKRKTEARYNGKKYAENLINSMAIIEKVNFTKSDLENIIEYKVMEKVDLYDVQTILNLKTAWEDIMRTLDKKLTLDYIIDINKTIASHQALKVGDIRDGVNSVGGLFEIETPNKELILKFIDKINKIITEGNNIKIENIAICLFYTLVINQWFYDGNKRTGFAIMNKILIQNGIGLVLITEELEKKFSEKLFLCYKEKGEKSKREFIEFIKNYCYIKF